MKTTRKFECFLITFLLMFCLFPIELMNFGDFFASATDTGWKNPTATGDDYNDWTNPINAYSQNDQSAVQHSNDGTKYQDYYNFGFSISAGSTINGITVSIDGYGAAADSYYKASLSWDGGAHYTDIKSSSVWGTSDVDTYFITGSSSDTWGHSWTVTQLSNTNFRLKVSPEGGGMFGCNVYFDHIRIKVDYTESNSAPTTTIDDIPDTAISSDVEPFTGGSSDSDGTIATVQVTISYNPGKISYWNEGLGSWGAEYWNTADASDGTFNKASEDWEYDITDVSHGSGSFTNGILYTVYAKAQDNDGAWDATPATDSFTYSTASPTYYRITDLPCNNSLTKEWIVVSSRSIIENNTYDYNFTDLAEYHNDSDNVGCAIVAIDDIINCSSYWNTTSSARNDTASILWQFFKDADTNWSADYGLLGGTWLNNDEDKQIIPYRLFDHTSNMVSDQYFTNFSSWYDEIDQSFGGSFDELVSNHNTIDMYVGRILIHDAEEVNNYVEKYITYRDCDDWNKTRSAAFVAGYQYDEGLDDYDDDVIDVRDGKATCGKSTDGFEDWNTVNRGGIYGIYDDDTRPNATYLFDTRMRLINHNDQMYNSLHTSDIINDDEASLIFSHGHGSTRRVMDLSISALELLSNTIPFYLYGIACDTSKYWIYDSNCVNTLLHYDNISGAWGIISSKYTSWYSISSSCCNDMVMARVFYDNLFDDTIGQNIPSKAFHEAVRYMWSEDGNPSGIPTSHPYEDKNFDYFGDPLSYINMARDTHDLEAYKMTICPNGENWDVGNCLQPSTAYDIYVSVNNRGTSSETAMTAYIYEDGSQKDSDTYEISGANSEHTYCFDYTSPASVNTTVEISFGIPAQSGETIIWNNNLSRYVGIDTDIGIVDIDYAYNNLTKRNVTVKVKNYCDYGISGINVNLTIDGDTISDSFDDESFTANQTRTFIIPATISSYSGEVVVCGNVTGLSGESYLGNNERCEDMIFSGSQSITIGSITPSTQEVNHEINISVTIEDYQHATNMYIDTGYQCHDLIYYEYDDYYALINYSLAGQYRLMAYATFSGTVTDESSFVYYNNSMSVYNENTSTSYQHLQAAIDAASNNNVLSISNGTWVFYDVDIAKPLVIQGNSTVGTRGENTILDSFNFSDGFDIDIGGVTLRRLKVINATNSALKRTGSSTFNLYDCNISSFSVSTDTAEVNHSTFNGKISFSSVGSIHDIVFNLENTTAFYGNLETGAIELYNLTITHYVNKTTTSSYDCALIFNETYGSYYLNDSIITSNIDAFKVVSMGVGTTHYIDNCIFTGINNSFCNNDRRDGIYLDGYSQTGVTYLLNVTNSVITGFDSGFHASDTVNQSSVFKYCDIYNNTPWGGWNNDSSYQEINATSCWWGATDGPDGNCTGSGDNITYYIAACGDYSSIPYNILTVDYKIPINGTTGVTIDGGVTCYAYTNSTNVDTLNITWTTNESDGVNWINKYTNISEAANDIESYTFTDFDNLDTIYWWKVYVDDGTYNISEIYYFTTVANTVPNLTSPSCSPASGVDSYTIFYFNITWEDEDGENPTDGYLNVSINRTGWSTNQSLSYISGDNTTGAVYSYSTLLTAGSYNYTFYAYDGIGYNSSGPHINPTVDAQSYSFTVTTASVSGEFEFKDWGLASPGSGKTTQYNISEDSQTVSISALNISNTGNVPINITAKWLSDPGSGVSMKYSITNTAPNHGTNMIAIDPSEIQIITNLVAGNSKEIWLFMDFIDVEAQSDNSDIRFTSEIYNG